MSGRPDDPASRPIGRREGPQPVYLLLDQGTTLFRISEHAHRLNSGNWGIPASILVTIGVVLPSADLSFKGRRYLLTGHQWTWLITIGAALTVVWLAVALLQRFRRRLSAQQFLEKLVEESDAGQPGQILPIQSEHRPAVLKLGTPTLPEIGKDIRHQQFGLGVVAALRETELGLEATIDFPPPHGRKTLLVDYLRLTSDE